MVYEWDEEVPQPKPPTNRVRLAVETYKSFDGTTQFRWVGLREATQADIARALGVTYDQLGAFLRNTNWCLAREKEQVSKLSESQGRYQQQIATMVGRGLRGPCAYCGAGNCGGCGVSR